MLSDATLDITDHFIGQLLSRTLLVEGGLSLTAVVVGDVVDVRCFGIPHGELVECSCPVSHPLSGDKDWHLHFKYQTNKLNWACVPVPYKTSHKASIRCHIALRLS